MKKFFGVPIRPRPLFCCEKMPEMAQGDARAVAVASYRRGCKGAGVSLMIVGRSACMVRGRGEGAAHDSRRQDAAIRGAWRRPGSQERQAGGYGGGSWPLVAVLLVVRIMNESRASCCPSWRAVGSIGRQDFPDVSPLCRFSLGIFRRRGRPFV